MVLIPNPEAFNYTDINRPAGPIEFNSQNPEIQQGKVKFQKMKELKQKFKEHNHRFKERSKEVGGDVKAHYGKKFFSFADALESYVDKKLGRFYVSRKEHDEVRRLYEHQLELAKQRAIMAEMEKEAIMGSALESRKVVEELSDDAKKLLELNNQLKELLKQSIDKRILSDSAPGSEIVIRTMKKIRGDFEKKSKKPKKIPGKSSGKKKTR